MKKEKKWGLYTSAQLNIIQLYDHITTFVTALFVILVLFYGTVNSDNMLIISFAIIFLLAKVVYSIYIFDRKNSPLSEIEKRYLMAQFIMPLPFFLLGFISAFVYPTIWTISFSVFSFIFIVFSMSLALRFEKIVNLEEFH